MASNYSLYVLALACIFMNMITPAHLQCYQLPPDTESPPATNGPPATRPPYSGYKYIPNHGYYKYHPQLVLWHLAYDVCRWERAHLFIANSESEAKNVSKLSTSNDWFWIGNFDLFDDKHYVTIYNQTEKDAGYDTYVPGEPSPDLDQNCGAMTKEGLLANHWCHVILGFMCEYVGY